MRAGPSDSPPARRRRRTRPTAFRVASLVLAVLSLLLTGPSRSRAAETERDLEPPPPWIFFPEPDEATAREIDEVIERFGDLNNAPGARDVLVRRFGVWSAPRLQLALGAGSEVSKSEPHVHNAALTLYVLRDTWGNARELWTVLPDLIRLVEEGAEPYRKAFAVLALGAFHGPLFAPPLPDRPDELLVRIPEKDVRRDLERAVTVIGTQVDDQHPHVRVAAALALGKSGDARARDLLRAETRVLGKDADSVIQPRQAQLLAVGLLPRDEDADLLIRSLEDEQADIRQAAALGVALQALAVPRPVWTHEPKALVRYLEGGQIRPRLPDGFEAVFARGVLAWLVQDAEAWRRLFDLAVNPLTKGEAARAAAQCLLFCEEPWLLPLAMERLRQAQMPDPSVVAAFLLRLGADGGSEGLAFCRRYLGNNARDPRGKTDWDVRYHAAVGILRGLAARRFTTAEARLEAIETLESGVKRGLPAGPFRDALDRVVGLERRRLLEVTDAALSEERVVEVEQSIREPYGLFARDLLDVAVVRLNDLVPIVFNVATVRPGTPGDPDRTGIPQRFLSACHEAWPYFSRLDLLHDRGLRPEPEMVGSREPEEEVRRR